MGRIYEELRGKQRVEIFGALPESVLNASAVAAIELWDMECIDANTLRLSLYERDIEPFRNIVRRCMCELKLLESTGGSRDKKMLRRRMPLLIAALAAAVLLFLSSLFIWEIELRGTEKLSRAKVLRALSQCGVENGCYWPTLSSDMVRSDMIRLLPEIAWMAVNVNGSRATVLIVERQDKPEIYDPNAAADVVAAKTGLIKRLSVKNGKAAVAPGEAVTEGELLVGGAMDSISGGTRFVRANACVTADTWYELCAVCPLQEEKKEPAAFSRSRYAIVLGKRRINLYFDSGKAIDECDKIIHNYKLGVEGLFSLPVTIVRERLISYRSVPCETSSAEAMQAKLDERLHGLVNGEIIQRSFTQSTAGELFTLTLRARCLEDIGRTVPIES